MEGWVWKPNKISRQKRHYRSQTEEQEATIWQPLRVQRGMMSIGTRGPVGQILEGRYHKCAFCKGLGERPAGNKCPVCKGRGEVSVMNPPVIKCAFCKGRGEDKPRSNVTCLVCKGKGVVPIVEPIEVCPQCKGTGHDPHNTNLPCGRCKGKGVVTVKGTQRFIKRPSGSELDACKVVYEFGEASRVDISRRCRISSAYAEYVCQSAVKNGYLEKVSRDIYVLTPDCEKVMEEEEKKELEKVTPEQRALLRKIEEKGGEATIPEIIKETEIPFDRAHKICNSLGERDFIDILLTGKVILTNKGRKALEKQPKEGVENDKIFYW